MPRRRHSSSSEGDGQERPEKARHRSYTNDPEPPETPSPRNAGSDAEDSQQKEIDAGFFAPSSPPMQPSMTRSSLRSKKSRGAETNDVDRAVVANAATSFYRQHRNLSDTSITSAHGFIDHRAQSSSQSKASVRSRRQMGGPSSALRTAFADRADEADEDEPGEGEARKKIVRQPSSISVGSQGRRDNPHSAGSRTVVDYPLHGSAVAIDGEDDALMQHQSPKSGSDRQAASPSMHIANSPRSPRQMLSRQASDLGIDDVEADVCFPMLTAPIMTNEGSTESRRRRHSDHYDMAPPTIHTQLRAPPPTSGLPYIGYVFDFSVLEEFAAKERESTGYFSSKPMGKSVHQGPSVSFSPEKATEMRRRNHHEDGPKQGRMGRMRKLSESVATPGARAGRYQRKLALFEGAANDANIPNGRLSGPHARTPLLDAKDGKAFGSMSTHQRNTPGLDEKDKPYRFSFYSNNVPSTVHTRFLSELPSEDQTFEELFTGHKPEEHVPQPPQWDDSTTAAEDPQQTTPSASNSNRNSVSGLASGINNLRAQLNSQAKDSAPPSFDGRKPKSTVMADYRDAADLEDNTWWLDVLCPTDAEMKCLSKAFGIHPLTAEDIQMEESREKIELFRNYYFVCFRSFDQDPYSPTYLEPLNMYIVVLREGTLSFHYRGTSHPQNVRRRIKQLKDFINVSSDWISYALIDDITDAFGPLIQNIEYEVDSIDELVLILKEAEQSDMLRRIGTCRKKVMGLLRLIGQKADVVKGLAKRCNENWSVAPKSDIGLYLSDIQDHLVTMTANLNHYEKILSRSHSNYLAQISIEMTDANNAINGILSKLTALGTVLVPMNLITGLFGMNVTVPGQGVEGLKWFFGIVAVLTAIAVIGGYATWRAIRK